MEQQALGAPTLPLAADGGLVEQVNRAFKSYHSILALSRSPLANSPLVSPALVRDAVSPTADERGHALRLVLRWAVGMLAPEPPLHPLGSARPLDDPSWRDPRWWRYNILRHRYIEPLHPDEFIAGGRYTETLVALTGIPSPDSFFEERNRAVREATVWMRQQLVSGSADPALRQLALEEILLPLRRQPTLRALLDLAATFEGVFPRVLLLDMAEREHIPAAETVLAGLLAQRLLRSDEDAQELWLSPALQAYLAGRQSEHERHGRHLWAAQYYAERDEVLAAARHWQLAGRWEEAAAQLLVAADDLIGEFAVQELYEVVQRFQARHISTAQWLEVQILSADLAVRLGRRTDALSACRRALRVAEDPIDQAAIYRRMAKLYEQTNQRHALNYYQQAAERLPPGHEQLAALYKDRAWLHILRGEWQAADSDLQAAQAAVQPDDHALRAAIYDALASLCRQQQRLPEAIIHARLALAIREQHGDPPQIADSHNNLGLLYSALGDTANALSAFEEALAMYRQLDNPERAATALINIGMAHHLAGRRRDAIGAYEHCLEICKVTGLSLLAVRTYYNLAEAHAELEEFTPAARYMAEGRVIARDAGFDDEVRDLDELAGRFAALAQQAEPRFVPAERSDLGADDAAALALARRLGRITPRLLMSEAHVSKATATRRLSDLARRGLLESVGKGRATAYIPSAVVHATAVGPASFTALPNLDPDLASVLEALHFHAPILVESLSGEAIAVAPFSGDGILRLLLRCRRIPELHAFFAVERRLSELLARRVDLLPAEIAAANYDPADLIWISFS
ncbi:MAG: tetratricopeptide repeat protein [Oscillochloris sp.]|nr:tetratricopeptide repeat protein [Oscillochloris sp.]